jgi:hypothetical protein
MAVQRQGKVKGRAPSGHAQRHAQPGCNFSSKGRHKAIAGTGMEGSLGQQTSAVPARPQRGQLLTTCPRLVIVSDPAAALIRSGRPGNRDVGRIEEVPPSPLAQAGRRPHRAPPCWCDQPPSGSAPCCARASASASSPPCWTARREARSRTLTAPWGACRGLRADGLRSAGVALWTKSVRPTSPRKRWASEVPRHDKPCAGSLPSTLAPKAPHTRAERHP